MTCHVPHCRSERLTKVSYGDGKDYWRCHVGHVTPKPPPPDLAAVDHEEDP